MLPILLLHFISNPSLNLVDSTSERYPGAIHFSPLLHDHHSAYVIFHMNFGRSFLKDLSESTLTLPEIQSLQSGQSDIFFNKNEVSKIIEMLKVWQRNIFILYYLRLSCWSDAPCPSDFSVYFFKIKAFSFIIIIQWAKSGNKY